METATEKGAPHAMAFLRTEDSSAATLPIRSSPAAGQDPARSERLKAETGEKRPTGTPAAEAPESVPQRRGPSPVWRSLLSPRPGLRALALDPKSHELFSPLAEAGVEMSWGQGAIHGMGGVTFDLVLEDWRLRKPSPRPGRITPLLAPGGRWVVVMKGRPFVGWAGRSALLQARRERFERVETYYAHPSLRSPQILVPMDRPEPVHYFLGLTLGARTFRQRSLSLGLRTLWILGIHREVLPNLIVVARRSQ